MSTPFGEMNESEVDGHETVFSSATVVLTPVNGHGDLHTQNGLSNLRIRQIRPGNRCGQKAGYPAAFDTDWPHPYLSIVCLFHRDTNELTSMDTTL
jgi:hypothetical protein